MKKNILLLRLDAIGDFVIFSSVLSHIRNVFKDDYLTLVVHPAVVPLAQTCPYIDKIFSVDQQRYAIDQEYASEIAEVVRGCFDVVINTMYTRTWQADNLTARSHAPVKIGFECLDADDQYHRRKSEGVLYTNLIPASTEWMFELERYRQLLLLFGINISSQELKPELWIGAEDEKWAAKYLEKQFSLPVPFAILCPGAGFDAKLWSTKSFGEVVNYLNKDLSMKVLILGSAKDKELAKEIAANSRDRIYDLTGEVSLSQFAALIKQANLFVGIDTAGFHIAWTFGIPTVGIFGGGHYGRFIPSMPHVQVVSHQMDCYKCYWNCIYDQVECIKSITHVEVISAIVQALKRKRQTV